MAFAKEPGEHRDPIESAAAPGRAADTPCAIPDYDLLQRTGRGAFGEVWLARSLTGKYVAVKLLPKSTRTTIELEGLRAYQHLAQRHPNLIEVGHIGQTETHYYYVLELADAASPAPVFTPESYTPRSVRVELDRHGPLGAKEAAAVAESVLAALAHLHAHGLLHRDVKPDNILYVNGTTKLGDVGLVTRALDPGPQGLTPQYAPPEGVQDASGDLYCAGRTLAEMLTGALPVGPPPWAASATTDPGTRALLEVAARATAPEADRRYSHAVEMARDVLQSTTATPPRRRATKTRMGVATATLALVAVAVAGILIRGHREAQAPSPSPSPFTVNAVLHRGGLQAEALAPGARVSPGDALWMEFTGSDTLYAYVIDADDAGEAYLLFPLPGAALRNPVPPGTHRLPGRKDGVEMDWTITSAGGREHLLVVASRTRLAEFERKLDVLAQPSREAPQPYARVTAEDLNPLRGIGGLRASVTGGPDSHGARPLFDFAAELASDAEIVSGVWVRQIDLVCEEK